MVFMASSCTDQDGISSGHAQLNVLLVDAPADYEEVWVEVLAVEVLPNDRKEDEGSAWISIPYQPEGDNRKVNLLSLVGDQVLFVGSKEVPAGKLGQIRLILGDDNYLVKNGVRHDLTTPSAQQSGLKLKVNKELQAGIQYDMMLDFDADRSIVKAGNSGKYILKPVIRVITEASASIRGKVLPVLANDPGILVYGIIGQDTVSTFTDANGVFMLRGLNDGTYKVSILPKAPYEVKVIDSVPTEKGKVTDLGEIELATSSN